MNGAPSTSADPTRALDVPEIPTFPDREHPHFLALVELRAGVILCIDDARARDARGRADGAEAMANDARSFCASYDTLATDPGRFALTEAGREEYVVLKSSAVGKTEILGEPSFLIWSPATDPATRSIAAIRAALFAGAHEVHQLALGPKGGGHDFRMSIPPNPRRDSDLILAAALAAGGDAIQLLVEARDRESAFALDKVLFEILEERRAQDAQWGGPATDDRRTTDQWFSYRETFHSRAQVAGTVDDSDAHRRALVQLAALCVAEVESLDRKAVRP